jgi:hypothetical protein
MRLASAAPASDDARWLDHLPAATLAAMLVARRLRYLSIAAAVW